MKNFILSLTLCLACGNEPTCVCDCEVIQEIRDDCNTGFVYVCVGCSECYLDHCTELSETEQCCLGEIDPWWPPDGMLVGT